MKAKVILNIDILGNGKYIKGNDKEIFLDNIKEGISRIYKGKKFKVSTDRGIYAGAPIEDDIVIRVRTENELISFKNPDLNLLKLSTGWKADRTIIQRYRASHKLRGKGYELFDINILIGDLSDKDTEKSVVDSVLTLDSLATHPDVNNARVFIFAFDELMYKVRIHKGAPDHNIESAIEETCIKRINEICRYVQLLLDTYEAHTSVDDFNKEINAKFEEIVKLDSSDGLSLMCI